MIVPTTSQEILATQRLQDRLEEAARWRLAEAAQASCVEQCGWRWSDVRTAFTSLVRIAFSRAAGIPGRTGAVPAPGQQSLWQA